MFSKNKLLIGIMVKTTKPLPSYEFARDLGVELLVFSPQGINWRKKRIDGLILKEDKQWKAKTTPFPLAIYNRLYSTKKNLPHKLEKIIGKGKVFNCITRFDKWEIYNILHEKRFLDYQPDTFLFAESTILELLHKYKQLILKPCISCLGRKVYLLKNTDDNIYQLYHNLNLPKIVTKDKNDFINRLKELIGNKKFIVQQFITSEQIGNKIYDIRIYVQKNSDGHWGISGEFCRIGFADSYISNYCSTLKSSNEILLEKNTMLSTDTLKEMKKIALKAAQAIEKKIGHLGEISVDFVLDYQGKPWIIEANGKTQKTLVKGVKDEDLARIVYRNPIEYACFLAKKHEI